ncbi:hypothetical protein M422DRAFT_41935 [Sphaerobolus stellatus SS14]|nr:hypothetical protein M422DRAFT_41935 [Sphaerobolus stellatus SS14]
MISDGSILASKSCLNHFSTLTACSPLNCLSLPRTFVINPHHHPIAPAVQKVDRLALGAQSNPIELDDDEDDIKLDPDVDEEIRLLQKKVDKLKKRKDQGDSLKLLPSKRPKIEEGVNPVIRVKSEIIDLTQ